MALKYKHLTFVIALLLAALVSWEIHQTESTTEKIPSVESGQNQPEEPSVISLEKIRVSKVANVPDHLEFSELSSDHLVNFRLAGDKILKGNQVLWSDDKEHISFVQESPDGSMIIFFKQNDNRYVIYRHENGELKKLDVNIPSRIHGHREDGWYWVGNDHLIREQIEDFDPAPRGHGDEGWIKSNQIYVFNLKTQILKEMALDDISHPKENDILLTDESDPDYTYKIPVERYYRIKGITRDGVIALKSVDTSDPFGGNPMDEGVYKLE